MIAGAATQDVVVARSERRPAPAYPARAGHPLRSPSIARLGCVDDRRPLPEATTGRRRQRVTVRVTGQPASPGDRPKPTRARRPRRPACASSASRRQPGTSARRGAAARPRLAGRRGRGGGRAATDGDFKHLAVGRVDATCPTSIHERKREVRASVGQVGQVGQVFPLSPYVFHTLSLFRNDSKQTCPTAPPSENLCWHKGNSWGRYLPHTCPTGLDLPHRGCHQ